jgi:phosphatidate cytidylyltransferase
MLSGASKRSRNIATAIAAVCGFVFVIGQTGIEIVSCAVYIIALMVVGLRGKLLGAIAGAYFAICAFALASLRMDDANGLLYIFGLFSVVWATDSSAYAIGRWLKGPKLFPVVSPNKTWSGFIGGIVAGIAAAALYSVLANIFLNPENLFKTIGNWSVVGLILSLATQIGDLIESMIKRYFGVKDTSKLIPGHGGLLDRMDGHLSAGLVFSILLSIPFVAALLK